MSRNGIINLVTCAGDFKIFKFMKKLLFVVSLLLATTSVLSQNYTLPSFSDMAHSKSTGKATDENGCVVECHLNKSVLWSNLKRWISKKFTSYKYTVDMEDKEGGTLIIKFNKFDEIGASSYVSLRIDATIQVDIKDKKYRYKISDASFVLAPNSKCDNINYLPTRILEMASLSLQAARNLSSNTDIPKGLDFLIKYYGEKLSNTPKYKKPKDEKKGKVNEEYKEIENTLRMANNIKSSYNLMVSSLSSSLEAQMISDNNDW